jgi:branched-chain amino acid transport system permease protein
MQDFLQHLLNGFSLGSIYALIALGYTMVYGILQFINFAHGEIFMLGAYFGFYAANFLGMSEKSSVPGFFIILIISMLGCALFGFFN